MTTRRWAQDAPGRELEWVAPDARLRCVLQLVWAMPPRLGELVDATANRHRPVFTVGAGACESPVGVACSRTGKDGRVHDGYVFPPYHPHAVSRPGDARRRRRRAVCRRRSPG
jgi:hypothetical protein